MTQAVLCIYLSPAAFYVARPERRASRERDLGLFWRSQRGPSFRAAWVRDTGELYLVQHGLGGRGGGSVLLLADDLSEEELDERLAGWADVCGAPGSLDWLLERIGDGTPEVATLAPEAAVHRLQPGRRRRASARPGTSSCPAA
jgi:hypothetical protein